MRGLAARVRGMWRRMRRARRLDADMHEEMRFHLEMEIERLQRDARLHPHEARRQAHVAFGGVEKFKEEGRDARGLRWLASMSLDWRLGIRMLLKYPGLTGAGGFALAIAIGIGAGWYDLAHDLFRPTMPFPGGHRIVEIEMRNSATSQDERRLLHDLHVWQRDARSVEDLGAYRTLERNLILGDAPPEPLTVAEITASAFRLVRVPPVLGRPLLPSDEQPGAAPVVVLGHGVWQRHFGGRTDAIGRTLQIGKTTTTVVGVMPQGFAFPINHRLWVPLQMRTAGYTPLEGPAVRVFARLAPGVTQAEAYAEITAITAREQVASPQTYEHLRPRVLAYGGESPGDRSLLEFALTHLPVLLVVVVACANVGTLIYARTATRDAEIAMRVALGASRARIVTQLFVEALVLASAAAVVGLAVAHVALKWGVNAYYSGVPGGLPFWIQPGLKPTTVLYTAILTVGAAALLGVLPALKATGPRVQPQLTHVSAGGSTLRFGGVWTTVMIGQVALAVICLPPALGISHEAWRDRVIRSRFPADEYLAVRVALDREVAATASGEETAPAFARRLERTYRELERRVAEESGVEAVTFADRLPGMSPAVQRAEFEAAFADAPLAIPNLWTSTVGPGFFQAFDIPIVAGRDFDDRDRTSDARTVIVNEAFARRYTDGASPVGRRLRYGGGNPAAAAPWREIVGMVRDIGMTPTDLGEAPYVFQAGSAATVHPLVMGIRTSGDPAALAPHLRTIAARLDTGLRLEEVRPLDDHAWRVDVPQMVAAGAIATVVGLGLFLSAAGIYSLMSVSVARRTREIGLRAALGAGRTRLLANVFARAAVLVGSGVAAGNCVLLLVVMFGSELALADVASALVSTSGLMLIVGLLACVAPARRALRIHPATALKDA